MADVNRKLGQSWPSKCRNNISIADQDKYNEAHSHFTSSCTDSCSEVPTEFCAWQVYSPASRRPTGRSCSVS